MTVKDKLRVLLIEDDEEDYILVRKFLSEASVTKFSLDWVQTYEAGLDAVCRLDYDAYLLDYMLAGRTGLELLAEANSMGCQAPVILLTGHSGRDVDIRAITTGASDYLVKGEINPDILDRSIRYAVERKKSEKELKKYRDRLEELVQQRTSELQKANLRLQKEIEEREKAERALRKQNRFLNSVLESLSHPFYVVDAKDYSLLLANSAASPGGLAPGATCFSLGHKRDRPCSGAEHLCPLVEIKKSKKPLVTEHTHFDSQGKPRYVEVHAHPILDEGGEVSMIIEYCLDISDRKEMEENLRRAHDELETRVRRRTAELGSANMALMNEIAERGRIEEALRLDEKRLEALLELGQRPWATEQEIVQYVLEKLIGLTRSEIGAIGFLDEDEKVLALHAWSPDVVQRCEPGKPVYFRVEGGGLWADSIRERRPVIVNDYSRRRDDNMGLPDGHLPLRRFMSIPIFEGERTVALSMVANKEEDYDQSDVRQLTLLMDGMFKLVQREKSVKALKESGNLAAIGSALSSVAHDLKTPLVAIGGFTKLVQSHLGEQHPDWGKLRIVLDESARLEKMVKDMLDFSKPLELEKSAEGISPIIDECFKIAKPMAEKTGVELQAECPMPAPWVSIDRSRIKQALINLLTNAIQASPEGKTVTVRCRGKGSYLVIDVADCGCGSPPENRQDIFVPFFTTKREGTGLGLAIVRKIVEAHNGHVEVLGNAGGGTTFRIILPPD